MIKVNDLLKIDFNCETIEKNNLSSVEFGITLPNDSITIRQNTINTEVMSIDETLCSLNSNIDKLNTEIDKLTNHADGLDYMVAVASGLLSGLIDIFFVGSLSISQANDWGSDKVNSFVIKVANFQGYTGNDLLGAVEYLEKNNPHIVDKFTNDFGGGLQHHLRDFSHHPTLVGLCFSLLTQFTNKAYGTDVSGNFKIVNVKPEDMILIGRNFPEKILFGTVNWFFHLVSDMAGSSGSIRAGKIGTGLPGPMVSLLKEVSALPFFNNANEKGYKELSVWISKLYNGTLLGEKDSSGNLNPIKFDLRTEIGLTKQISKQAIPVIINECIVRGFYFIRKLFTELKKQKNSKIDFSLIDWKSVLPFNTRTIARMITISSGCLTAVDLVDAAIKSKGIDVTAFILHINFVGIGRFAIAAVTDIGMGYKKRRFENERLILINEKINLSRAKLYYLNADLMCEYGHMYETIADMHRVERELWIEVKSTDESMVQLDRSILNAIEQIYGLEECKYIVGTRIAEMENAINKYNPELLNDIFRR